MFNKKQLERLQRIRTVNKIKQVPLSQLAIEEMGELLVALAKYNMNEGKPDEILEESIDVFITLHNYITFHFNSKEIENMIDRKLAKAEDVLKLKGEY